MNINTFKNEQNWIDATLKYITGENIALSGGSTPRPIYDAMQKLPGINLINFYQIDERYIPNTDKKSNQKMIKETLNPKQSHFINTSIPIEEAVTDYEKKLPKQFDLVLLGIGTDGHTASLFPHDKALSEANKKVTKTIEPNIEGGEEKNRITLTFPPIMNSKTILVLLRGEEKKKILGEIFQSEKLISELPAKKLLDHPNLHIHYLTS